MTGAGIESASALAHTGSELGVSPTAGVSPLAAKTLAKFLPNEIGQIIAREWLRLAEAWPGVRLLAHQVMEDHFHGVIATPSFMKKPLEIAHGAAVVSPCISEGERELARLAFDAGAKVITLQNKGFSPLYKPGGRYFEACANGRLLMLAPAAWPYLPGQKPITRWGACTLNRIAQLIAGSGAAAINYRGMQVADVDRHVAEAVKGAVQWAGRR